MIKKHCGKILFLRKRGGACYQVPRFRWKLATGWSRCASSLHNNSAQTSHTAQSLKPTGKMEIILSKILVKKCDLSGLKRWLYAKLEVGRRGGACRALHGALLHRCPLFSSPLLFLCPSSCLHRPLSHQGRRSLERRMAELEEELKVRGALCASAWPGSAWLGVSFFYWIYRIRSRHHTDVLQRLTVFSSGQTLNVLQHVKRVFKKKS